MSHCPGSNCKLKKLCQKHYNAGQVIDWSTYGSGSAGIDENGNNFCHHEIHCGDNGTYGYAYFKAKEKSSIMKSNIERINSIINRKDDEVSTNIYDNYIKACDDLKIEKILCAAIWYMEAPNALHQPVNIDRGVVISGYRHGSIIAAMGSFGEPTRLSKTVQGFLTSKNRFLDRSEALELVKQTGQCIPEYNDELYSEDLY